ncbi:MAG: hypothetical protein II144_00075 [Paludibacteraceae bacterium]|nr:hypothetical protein [Paludibacteraceae bacterium]
MKRNIVILALCSLILIPAYAQDSAKVAKQEKKEAVKSHLKQHFKPYGFIRNYFTYDSRESWSGTADLYNYQPKDQKLNDYGDDLNAESTFRFLSLTTRLGLNIVDYKWRGTEFGGKIEADFYAGLSTKTSSVDSKIKETHAVSGVAQFRLRQAYLTLGWDSLKMLGGKDYARVDLTIGQTWHPMAADLCDAIALNSGAPFGPFNRSPQVKMDARLGKYVTLTAAGLWQMQYLSIGPGNLQSAEYMLYGKTPEAYLGLSVHTNGFLMRAGADVLSIKPRHQGTVADATLGKDVTVHVNDRITTASPFLYLQYKKGDFSLKAKTIFAESGEHMNMYGGYGVKAKNADGSYEYTPIRHSTSWVSLVYGGKVGAQEEKHPQKLQGILFAGYVKNFGTKEALMDLNGDGKYTNAELFTPRSSAMNQMYRLSPTLLYTVGKFQLGLEYELTSVQYGDGVLDDHGLSKNGLHWVSNHRVQLMTKYNF